MDQIEYPSIEVWDKRREWFENIFNSDARGGGYIIGEHATGLLVDLQALYCAGAFISSVIIACTIVDSHLREAELDPNFQGGIQAAFNYSDHCSDLEWLRKQRNKLTHFKATRTLVICVEDQWTKRPDHEQDARRAIELVAKVLFENPWT